MSEIEIRRRREMLLGNINGGGGLGLAVWLITVAVLTVAAGAWLG